jgi:hypothetical protein
MIGDHAVKPLVFQRAAVSRYLLPWLLLIAVSGCSDLKSLRFSEASLRYPSLTRAAIHACPVTRPNGWNHPPVLADLDPGERPSLSASEHGNGTLWISGFPIGGKILAHAEHWDPDGSLRWKMGWWRGVPGRLQIVGRRLDAPAPPLQVYIPEGYGGLGFQAVGLHFPSEGCWELTGRLSGPYGQTSLRVVVLVMPLPFHPLTVAELPKGLSWKDVEVEDLPSAVRMVYAPVVEGRERVRWGWKGGIWSREGEWVEAPVFGWGYGVLMVETAWRGWRGGPPDPAGRVERVWVRGRAGRCVESVQEDAAGLMWEEGGMRYRVLQWGLGLGCEELRRVVEGERR